jgi:hypothetical protein
MKLSQEQLDRFDRDGYLFFSGLFTPEEISGLQAEVPRLYAQHDVATTSYPLWTIDRDTFLKLVERGGIVAPNGECRSARREGTPMTGAAS